jgi:hypothetical protein
MCLIKNIFSFLLFCFQKKFPIIKSFIHSAVKTVMEQFTAPNYIDLDLGQLLTGDDLLHGIL